MLICYIVYKDLMFSSTSLPTLLMLLCLNTICLSRGCKKRNIVAWWMEGKMNLKNSQFSEHSWSQNHQTPPKCKSTFLQVHWKQTFGFWLIAFFCLKFRRFDWACLDLSSLSQSVHCPISSFKYSKPHKPAAQNNKLHFVRFLHLELPYVYMFLAFIKCECEWSSYHAGNAQV